ncbi:hypothetical protein [Kingella denitrificans]|uniref:hypothetical protein n=1 Tax=Kingella denitrificans TaxID=502 RepID=UPI0028D0A2A9|nr:hypothetical protein [Kingella denitrificans]
MQAAFGTLDVFPKQPALLREDGRGRPPKVWVWRRNAMRTVKIQRTNGKKAAYTRETKVQAAFFRDCLRCGF